MRFLVDGAPLKGITAPPYSLNWLDAFAGTYRVVADVTDNLGAVTASAVRRVRMVPPPDNLRPTVASVRPGAGIVDTAGDTPTIVRTGPAVSAPTHSRGSVNSALERRQHLAGVFLGFHRPPDLLDRPLRIDEERHTMGS